MGERSNSEAVFAIQSRFAIHANHVKDHIFHNLYNLICRREWLEKALNAVLDNEGSKTAGVDGITKRNLFETDEARDKFLDELQDELKTGNYHPLPVLRKWIPKRKKGEQRPIGIPTLKDRVVQMLLKMALEPIFECDFLCNSNGFRLGRSTLECVLPLYQYGNREVNYNWVIEGDIQACFDNINHETLMKSIQKRIGDRKVLRLMWRFLKAPVKDKEHKLAKAKKGVPQGAILSPLLANIALNEFDQYWFERWGTLDFHQRERRLKHGQANCVLFRYADDFILSANGTREAVESIMKDITQFFADKLKLNLNLSDHKTLVVSIDEGFKFLGFQISRERLGGFRSVRIRPTQENVIRLKTKLQEMLGKKADKDDPLMKVIELNRVLQGWSGYFCRVNSWKQFKALDYFASKLFLQWYCRSRKIGLRKALSRIQHKGKIVIARDEGDAVWLYHMSEERPSQHTALKHHELWKYRHIGSPYLLLEGAETNAATEPNDPMNAAVAVRNIHPIDKAYGEIYLCNRIVAMRRDGFRCRKCGSRGNLATHHIVPVTRRGNLNTATLHSADNLTLCKDCHIDAHSKSMNTSVRSTSRGLELGSESPVMGNLSRWARKGGRVIPT